MGLLVQLVFDLIVAGVLLYIAMLIIAAIPMLAPFKQVIMAILFLIAVVVLWQLLSPLILGGGLSVGHCYHARC